MEIDVVNMEGKKVRTVTLPADVFEAPVRIDLMHQAYVRQLANARLGTHDTQTREDVSGGGRKPWRQKGTGRARQGSIRSAQWVGGARVHTPHPRKYTQAMPRKMRRAALRSALSVKAAEANIVVVDELVLSEPKTRMMAAALNILVGQNSALILIPEKEAFEGIVRSSNNIPDVKTLLASYMNIRDLLKYNKILMPVTVIDQIASHLA